jgi:type VI secretion system secreted protein VgrG
MFNPHQPRTLSISGAALPTWAGGPVLTAVRLSGTEKLGKLYEYALEVMTVDEPALGVWQAKELVSADALIGQEISASIEFEGKGTFIPGLPGDMGSANVGAGRREITGLITEVRCTGADDRHVYYRFTVRPWLWVATRNRQNRIFQNMSVVGITESILKERRYPFLYEMRLAAPGFRAFYPKRDYVRQAWESDFDFLRRLWREWGLYFFMDGATLVLCDSPGSHKPHGPAYDIVSYHAPDGRQIDEEHIHKLELSRALTAGAVSLIDYDYTRSRARLGVARDDAREMAFANAEHYGWGDYSQPLAGTQGLSETPNDYEREAGYLARVRVDAMRCRSLRARGTGNVRGLRTGCTFHLENHPLKAANAEYLVVATEIDIRNVAETSQRSGDGAQYQCVTHFVLQPANTFFKNRPKKKKPHCGAETAFVVGPRDKPMWVDGYARVKVQFIWDRLGESDQTSSCWVRVSSPWQGNGFGAIYLPRIGQEVTVNYHEGDPDKPYVADRMVNQFNQPPWQLPKNQALSGTRSRDLEGRQYNHIVADDTPGQLQVQAASDYAQSRLVLGYNTRIEGHEGRKEARGEGVELATNAWAVVRAGRGMLLSTEARAGATAPVKDMGETVQRLAQAREQHEELATLAQLHKAQRDGVDQNDAMRAIKAQNDAIRGGDARTDEQPFPQLARPDMVLASAAGISMTAAQGTHLASEQDLAVTTGRDVSLSSGRSLLAAVKGAVSIFAYRLGMKLIAAQGKVEMQAQSDAMALAALKDITVTSTDGKIILNAMKEIWIGAGGSYIKINAEGIENATPGKILERTAFWDKPGAAALAIPMPELPIPAAERRFSNLIDLTEAGSFDQDLNHAWSDLQYSVTDKAGNLLGSGVLDKAAAGVRFFTREARDVDVWIGTGIWDVSEEVRDDNADNEEEWA